MCPACDLATYPKEVLPSAIKNLCKETYQLEVDVKIVNRTLGVRLYLDNLVNLDSSLNKDALDTIKNVIEAVRRICLSTNADLDFFYLICIDSKLGYKVVMIRYLPDLIKIMIGSISKDDFVYRMKMITMPSAKIFGQKMIQQFFSDMERMTNKNKSNIERYAKRLIKKNFSESSMSLDHFYSLFSLDTIYQKEKITFTITALRSTPISANAELFYVRIKKKYILTEEYEEDTFLSNKDFSDYLFLVSVENFSPKITNVFSLFRQVKQKKLIFPKQFKSYDNIDTWTSSDFFVENISFPQFLATQIAKRIRSKIKEKSPNPKEKEDELKFHIQGKFTEHPKHSVELVFSGVENLKKEIQKNVVAISRKIFKNVCLKYKYYKFQQINFVNLKPSQTETIMVKKGFFKRGPLLKEAFGPRDY